MAKPQPVLGLKPADSVLSNATLIVPIRVGELVAWERFVSDPANVIELHEMRIAAKRLRYTLELLAPLYDGAMDEFIDRVKKIQEHLGTIHDADVLVPQLESHLLRTLKSGQKAVAYPSVYGDHFEAAAGLLELCRRKRDERTDRYARFQALWHKMRDEAFFERLRATVQRAAADEADRVVTDRAAQATARGGSTRSRKQSGGGE